MAGIQFQNQFLLDKFLRMPYTCISFRRICRSMFPTHLQNHFFVRSQLLCLGRTTSNMNRIYSFFIFILVGYTLTAQEKSITPLDLVSEAKQQQQPTSINPFQVVAQADRSVVPTEVGDYTLLKMDRNLSNQILKNHYPFITLTIPQTGRNNLTLELVEVKPMTEDFMLRVAPSMEIMPISKAKHYRGIIQGAEKSIAAISFFEDEVMGVISHPAASGNIVLGNLDNSDQIILYQDDSLADQFQFDCQAKDGEVAYTSDQLRGVKGDARSLTDCVRLYLEVDNDIYINKGSSVSSVQNFITGIFNQVATLYAAEQLNIAVSEIVVWTQTSPYTGTNSIGMLNSFTSYRQGFNGDLAQLLSYKASGGVAYVDGLCRSNPDFSMSYAGISSSFQTVPTYSWSVEVTAHEFGHLFGSQHTHACVWNGNNTAIDGCYTPEGSCPNPGIPSGGGTIMSYCHLTATGINFTKGFGLQPGNVMRSEVTNAACLQPCQTGGGGNTCTQNTLSLELRTDNYPTETSWNIKNAQGTVVYSGSQYTSPNTLYNIALCLPTGCFTFTINDGYGDGICCTYGSGYYRIKQGTVILTSGSTFGSSETKSFCATGTTTTSCTDGIKNGSETGIDCGGPDCPACPTCTDGIKNGSETGIDCGGANCPACPSCTDGVKNGQETGVDCGGPSCPACPSCADGVQNGTETGIDCGGSCAPCQSNGSVMISQIAGHYFEAGLDGWLDGGTDCARTLTILSPEGSYSIQLRDNSLEQSAMTSPVWNFSQFDSVTIEFSFRPTGFETGEDFWIRYYNGSTWTTIQTLAFPTQFNNNITYTGKVKLTAPLAATAQLRFQCDGSDNSDIVYVDAVVVKGYKSTSTATCTDGIKNGLETGIDCGGPTCPACPTCSDGIKNGTETGIDCGGSCPPCATASCTDGIKNGQETAIDCGGPTCPACPTCSDGIKNGTETGVDCGGSCPACPSCSDGVQNGTETGVDCGGTCPACPSGGNYIVLSGHYFETGMDGWIDGGSDCFRYQGPLSPEGAYSIRLRDNSDVQSAMTSPFYQLANYASVQVEFKMRGESMDAGEDFQLQYFNGIAWSTIGTFASGTHFNNNQLYTFTVTLQSNLANSAQFRFMCNGSENDDIVYIDAVIIRASTTTGQGEIPLAIVNEQNVQVPADVQHQPIGIFPNPTTGILNLDTEETILRWNMISMSGILVATFEGNVQQADLSHLPAGLYLIRIETEDKVYTAKVRKE